MKPLFQILSSLIWIIILNPNLAFSTPENPNPSNARLAITGSDLLVELQAAHGNYAKGQQIIIGNYSSGDVFSNLSLYKSSYGQVSDELLDVVGIKVIENGVTSTKSFKVVYTETGNVCLKAVSGVGNIVAELTQTAKNHLKYGEIKITIKNSSTGDIISTSVRKPIDPPISVPSSGVNVSVDISGIHFENALQTVLIEEVANTRALVKTLPSGEQIFKSKIKVFVQEMNNGQGGWKTVAKEKTWWPSSWNDEKVWGKISEAFNNKTSTGINKWEGLTTDGIKIEMYTDALGNISTAYIIP